MRLIDADALDTRERGNNSQRTMWWEIKHLIKEAPTIDPESLRPQGEWEAYPSDQYRRCSHCKTEWEKEKIPRIANYCLYCGAKMKGE